MITPFIMDVDVLYSPKLRENSDYWAMCLALFKHFIQKNGFWITNRNKINESNLREIKINESDEKSRFAIKTIKFILEKVISSISTEDLCSFSEHDYQIVSIESITSHENKKEKKFDEIIQLIEYQNDTYIGIDRHQVSIEKFNTQLRINLKLSRTVTIIDRYLLFPQNKDHLLRLIKNDIISCDIKDIVIYAGENEHEQDSICEIFNDSDIKITNVKIKVYSIDSFKFGMFFHGRFMLFTINQNSNRANCFFNRAIYLDQGLSMWSKKQKEYRGRYIFNVPIDQITKNLSLLHQKYPQKIKSFDNY